MPLWNKNPSAPKAPTWLRSFDTLRVYATYRGWVLGYPKHKEETLVDISNLDTTLGAPVVYGVYLSENAPYTQTSTANVHIAYDQSVQAQVAVAYTGNTATFTVGETVVQGTNTATVVSSNSTVLIAKANVGVFIATANVATKITGLTSNNTANVTTVTVPTMNVTTAGATTTPIVASYADRGTTANQLKFSFTIPSFVDAIIAINNTSGTYTVGETVTQGNTSGKVSAANSTQLSVNATSGTWTTSTNATMKIIGASSNAQANVGVITTNTVTITLVGQTIATNTSVNLLGNNGINCTATFANGVITTRGGIANGANSSAIVL